MLFRSHKLDAEPVSWLSRPPYRMWVHRGSPSYQKEVFIDYPQTLLTDSSWILVDETRLVSTLLRRTYIFLVLRAAAQ